MRAEIPDEQPDWDDRCKAARLRLWYAAEAAISAQQPAQLTSALGRLHAAREEFGGAMLALDKKRRAAISSGTRDA